MRNVKKNKIKNLILTEVYNNRSLITFTFAENLKHDIELVSFLVEEMRDEGFVELLECTSRHSSIPKEYIVTITNKGKFFLKIDNGYFSIINKERRTLIWYYLKTTALVINALAILIIGIYSLILSEKNSELEKEKIKLEKEIKSLEKKIDIQDRKTIDKDTITIT